MRKAGLALLAGILSSVSLAQQIPLENWTVPPYVDTHHSTSGGIVPMTDITQPRVFVGVQPCRVVDTRGGGVFTGTYGPPAIAANETRPFDINSAPHCPGIPAGVSAYSLNFTVTQTAGAPGDIRVWPTGNPPPPGQVTSVLNWTVPNATVANATIMPAGTSGSIDVQVAGTATHLLIDINGYFAADFGNPNTQLYIVNNSLNSTISALNVNTTGGSALAGTSWGGTGVSGIHSSTGAANVVYGVYGGSNSQHFDSVGVKGDGYYKGVLGISHPVTNGAGVLGTHQPGINVIGNYATAGVRGQGSTYGVLGISTNQGVVGALNRSPEVWGSLGHAFDADPPGSPPWGVFAGGNFGAIGTKHFLDPHPTDPRLAISYVSLEGPEAGTYFRGRARFQSGIARILVPEHFRLVTDSEGLTVQVTPIGAMATVAVLRMDLNEIVVQSSRNVEFSYLVQGVRSTFRDIEPVISAGDFRPRSADARLPGWLSPAQKRLLIQNGTYREDGSVNMETARRLGWDKICEKSARPAPQPEQP